MVHKKIWLLCVVLCLCACDNERAIRPSFIGGSSFTHDPISFPEESSSSSAMSSSNASSSSSSSSSSNGHDTTKDYIYSDYYGPFELDASDFNATFRYELNTISSQTIFERIRLLNASNSVVASSSKTKINYIKGEIKEVTFLVPIHDYWSKSGLTLKFEILNYETREILKDYSVTFYPPAGYTILGQALKQSIYVSKCLGFYGDGDTLHEIVEAFDFRMIGNYWNVDYYYRFIINQNPFLYYFDHELSASSIYLTFNDSDYVFPYISHDENDNIVIPLSIKKDNQLVTFSYKNFFFVDKRTLDISDTYRTGFTITRDFYLPINGRSKLFDKQFYIQINSLGFDKLSTSIPLKYDATQSLVGLCTDGEYYVSGGNKS